MANCLSEQDLEGLARIRELNKEFLNSGKGSVSVRDFLKRAVKNETMLLVYLRGRKHRPDHAWETLKRKAELRYDEYPDTFQDEVPQLYFELETNLYGLLKSRDSEGRRILAVNAGAWDTNKYTMEDINTCGVHYVEAILYDEDVMNNGLVVLQNCSGMGWRHAQYYTLPSMLRWLNIYWHGMPLLLKKMYIINIPGFFPFVIKLIEPFFSKKLKERLHWSTKSKNPFEELHKMFPPDILPEFLGGTLKNEDAFEKIIPLSHRKNTD